MKDMKDLDSATLARIDERTQAQTTSFALHVKEDAEKFDKVFNFVSKNFDKIDERFDKIDEKIDERFNKIDKKIETLWDDSNKRKGAFNASKLMSGSIWAIVVLIASYFIPGHSQ